MNEDAAENDAGRLGLAHEYAMAVEATLARELDHDLLVGISVIPAWQSTENDAPSAEIAENEWRGYDETTDSADAGSWDQGHAEWCVYWPDCQSNGDHPNPHIFPPGSNEESA